MTAIELLYQAALEYPAGQTLMINAHAHTLLTTIHAQAEHMDIQQHFKPEHAAIANMGLPVSSDWPASDNSYDLILLSPAKNKQQTLAWMAEAMRRLPDHGKIIMACANTHGAKSYESALKQLAGNLATRPKSKCRVFAAHKAATFDAALAKQWIDAGKARHIQSHGLIAQPGLFSWDRPDTGSALLLKNLPECTGTGMDLCCGYGLLAEHILRYSPAIERIHLVEADRLALDCARRNTTSWQDLIQCHWIDAATEKLPDKLDWMVCNPPFHSGQTRDVALGQTIVTRACNSLKRGGLIYLVANRKLPYERLLQLALRQCHTLVEADGFKIIKGIK